MANKMIKLDFFEHSVKKTYRDYEWNPVKCEGYMTTPNYNDIQKSGTI